MEPDAGTGPHDKAYEERIRSSTLSELEDMYAHVDRGEYPLRAEGLRGRDPETADESGKSSQPADLFKCGVCGLISASMG